VCVEVVLLRARDKKLRLGGERSTATRRWRPEMVRGRRGARARSHQGRGKRSGLGGDDAWAGVAAGGGAREVCAGGERRWQVQRAERKRRARGRRSREVSGGLVCDF
jgi:hypothetical protein